MTAAGAGHRRSTRTLAEVYRHFAEIDPATTSPLYERVAAALSESEEALRAIEHVPARRRQPRVILAALYPAVALAAHRTGADAVGLIDVGASGGLAQHVDRVGITYVMGRSGALTLGDAASSVQLSASVVGTGAPSTRAIPEVVARIGVHRDPVDVTDADDTR